jgi:hypothetical protein
MAGLTVLLQDGFDILVKSDGFAREGGPREHSYANPKSEPHRSPALIIQKVMHELVNVTE